VTQSAPADVNTVVTYSVGGTATAGSDYTALSGTVTILAGQTTATIDVTVINDGTLESDETVVVTLTGITSGDPQVSLGTPLTATVTITDNDTATANLSVTQNGNETGPVNIVYTVTLDKVNNTFAAITFDLTDLGTGTATSGSDYTAFGGSAAISVAVGSSTGSVTVTVTNDGLLEADTETVIAQISNPSNGDVTIGTASATATITDNDSATANLSVTQNGNETGPVNIVYTVTLDKVNNTFAAITFDLTDLGTGTATSGSDYTAFGGSAAISVAVGSITGTLTVPVLDNTYVEPVETVVALLSNPDNGDVSIGIGTATATIADDDTASVSVASVGVMENGGSALFTVTLLGDVQDPFDVYYTTSDVTAQAGFDYVTATGTLSFHSVSGTTATFTVSINDDAITEATEYYNVILTGISTPLVGIGQGTATGTIWDEDFSSIAIRTATPVVEGTAVEFPVTLTGAVQGGLTIAWSTSDGTAVAPGDYVAASGTVTFVGNDGETQTITITSNDDNIMESTENLTVTLGEITGFGGGLILIYAGDESAEGTLLDNDYSEVTVQATADGYEPSTNGQFTVVLSKPVDIPTTVTYTVGGNATMGAD